MRIHVSETASGYLPVMTWGEGADMDRRAYAMSYRELPTAELVAREWAVQEGVEYVDYKAAVVGVDDRMPPLVKQLREEQGIPLRAAIARAREILAFAPGR